MKTWEMLKELTENPKKRFRRKDWQVTYIYNDNGHICDSNNKQFSLYFAKDDDVWEEIITEVSWQEAVEALISGQNVKCIVDGFEYIYESYGRNTVFIATNGDSIGIEEIVYGEWYIL